MPISAFSGASPTSPQIHEHNIKRRYGESIRIPPDRSQRLVSRDSEWYYRTRECELVGPYRNRENAEKAVRTYIRFCRNLSREPLLTLVQQHLKKLRLQTEEEGAQPLREGEMDIPASRRPRITQQGARWYFQTREGELVGPYGSRETAEEASDIFLQFVLKVDRRMIRQLIATMNFEAVDARVG